MSVDVEGIILILTTDIDLGGSSVFLNTGE